MSASPIGPVLHAALRKFTAKSIPFAAASGLLTEDNAKLVYDAGKVGIGKNTPSYALDVVGTIACTGTVSCTSLGITGPGFTVDNSAAGDASCNIQSKAGSIVYFSFYDGGAAKFSMAKGATNAFSIYDWASGFYVLYSASGKVGIGTATPHSTLAVTGLPIYANNAAAIAGGLAAGDFYRLGGDPDHVCVVH
jgi:hypothetical protein